MALVEKFKEVVENDFYSAAYHRHLREKKLVGSRCGACGRLSVPPKPLCPKCRGTGMSLVEMKGKGRLASYSVIAVPPPLMVEEGFDRSRPYCSGVVELEEGPKVMARILGVDLDRPDRIRIGTPLGVEFTEAEHDGDMKTFLAFRVLAS
ncbi:MAG: Zn-ribbon domain-containing OB-fold protein [Deltaproteobacteria bacterium]|nr:Zn-ribbon domain-containing OB-fold protein [Deltaproteobacteria bacterium]